MKRIVFPGIALIAVSYAFARSSFGLFLPNIAESLGLSEAASGAVGSLAYMAYCLALLSSALLIYRIGSNQTAEVAGLSAVLGMIGIAVAPNLFVLSAAVLVAGLSSGWTSPALSQTVSDGLPPAERDRGNTWINTGTGFGLVLSGPMALLFAGHWRFAYALFALIGIGVMLWNKKAVPASKELGERAPISLWNMMKQWRKSVYLLSASFVVGVSSAIYWTFARSFLTEEYGMGSRGSVAFWVLMGAAGVLGGIAGGTINRCGIALSYRISIVILAFSVALITVPFFSTIYLSAILFNIAYIFSTGVFIVWGTRIFAEAPAVGVSFSFLLLGIGQFLGSLIAGVVLEVLSYPMAFLLFAGIGLAGLAVPIKKE
ncbi:MFS transporter [Paenibacillus senegalensis]|uniref:MFS transporter n=1 Tax=Paenibacillus senegalensis TaxID=1465766 RepID=UPI0002885847|nr:MFS transporter [Paenibacillus senegalensis]